MHINDDKCIEMAYSLGFNAVEIYDKNKIKTLKK